MKYLAAAVASTLLFAGGASLASAAQSLGELARQEEARRNSIPIHAKVYTNDTLRKDTSAPVPPVSSAQPGSPASSAPAAGTSAPKAASPPTAPASPATVPPPAAQGEAAWRKRIADAREGLERSKMFQDALQSQINGLSADFTARDDPAQRAKIANDRQKALAELDRVKEETLQFQKKISDIQEEARRAGVPAGWVR